MMAAKTIETYYQHFPSGPGLSALDSTLKEQLRSDSDLARIDLFTVSDAGAELITMELPTIPVKTAPL